MVSHLSFSKREPLAGVADSLLSEREQHADKRNVLPCGRIRTSFEPFLAHREGGVVAVILGVALVEDDDGFLRLQWADPCANRLVVAFVEYLHNRPMACQHHQTQQHNMKVRQREATHPLQVLSGDSPDLLEAHEVSIVSIVEQDQLWIRVSAIQSER